jgi:hypothetical protein
MIADPIRFGTKFLRMLFCGAQYQYDLRRSGHFATDSLKRLTSKVAKFSGVLLGWLKPDGKKSLVVEKQNQARSTHRRLEPNPGAALATLLGLPRPFTGRSTPRGRSTADRSPGIGMTPHKR